MIEGFNTRIKLQILKDPLRKKIIQCQIILSFNIDDGQFLTAWLDLQTTKKLFITLIIPIKLEENENIIWWFCEIFSAIFTIVLKGKMIPGQKSHLRWAQCVWTLFIKLIHSKERALRPLHDLSRETHSQLCSIMVTTTRSKVFTVWRPIHQSLQQTEDNTSIRRTIMLLWLCELPHNKEIMQFFKWMESQHYQFYLKS